MSAIGDRAVGYPVPQAEGHRRLRGLGIAGGVFVAVYAIATVAGAPPGVLTHVFVAPMAVVLVVGWWAALRAPREVRSVWLMLASASTLWAVGSVGWEVQFAVEGGEPLQPPTVWDPLFAVALALAAIAVGVAIQRAVVLRHVAVDAVVVLAAATVIGVAYADGSRFGGLNVRAAIAFDRPLFGLVTLVMISTAALGTSEGIRRSTVLLGVSQAFLVLGHLLYGYQALRHPELDYRWCDVAWATGAVVGILAGASLILRDDPLMRFGPPVAMTAHPRGTRAAVLVAAVCLTVATGGVVYGVANERPATVVVALAALAICILGLVARVQAAVTAADEAFRRLDRVVFEHELACDQLRVQNERLAHSTAMLRRYQRLVRSALRDTDAATDGELAALIAEAHGLDPDAIATATNEAGGEPS